METYVILISIVMSAIILTLPCWAFYILVRRIYGRAEVAVIWLNHTILNKGIKYYIEKYQTYTLNNMPIGADSTFDDSSIKLD